MVSTYLKTALPLLFILCVSVNAQYPESIYPSGNGSARSPREQDALRELYRQEIENNQFNSLRNYSDNVNSPIVKPLSDMAVTGLMPKSITDIAKKNIVPDEKFMLRHKDFLKLPNTGIVKMLPGKICEPGKKDRKKKIDEVINQCPPMFINGHGKYFSFRQKEYVRSRFADIGIHENWIFSLGLFNQGIMTNIGDAPLEQVSLSTKGVDYLNGLSPSVNIAEIEKSYKEFETGVTKENLTYQKVLPLELENTYVLRVTAYNLDWIEEKDTSIGKIKIYPLKLDQRKDILVAFRIIGRDDEGNTTLIWKELLLKDSPKLKVPKKKS